MDYFALLTFGATSLASLLSGAEVIEDCIVAPAADQREAAGQGNYHIRLLGSVSIHAQHLIYFEQFPGEIPQQDDVGIMCSCMRMDGYFNISKESGGGSKSIFCEPEAI